MKSDNFPPTDGYRFSAPVLATLVLNDLSTLDEETMADFMIATLDFASGVLFKCRGPARDHMHLHT